MKKNLKVAYLASEYPGISHTFIFREIKTLRELGFQVLTASIRRPAHLDKMTTEEKSDAHSTLYIKSSSPWQVLRSHGSLILKNFRNYTAMFAHALSLSIKATGNVFKGIAYFLEAGILLEWMHKNDLNHVHVHFANPAATVAMIASYFGTTSFSLSVHGPDIFYNVDTALLAQKAIRAVRVRCISHYCRSQLMRLLPHEMWAKLEIVRCGVDREKFIPRPDPDNGIPEILCVGRLVPAKGQHILLSACGILKQRSVAFSLTFVGDGEDRSSLEDLAHQLGIENNIVFTGAVGQDQVLQYYERADIFAIASFAEGVPVVLMEAMAMEIASVSTNITGIPELIDHLENGLLTTPSDMDGLADALEQLLLDRNLRITLGKKGREKVVGEYDLKVNCRKMADFFDNIFT